MITLSFLSTRLPPKAHRHQCTQELPSPEAWPRAKAAWRAVPFRGLRHLEKLVGRTREFRETGFRQSHDPIVHHVADEADRNRDPFAAALAVNLRALDPTAVFLAEVFGDIRDIDAFVRKVMRQ